MHDCVVCEKQKAVCEVKILCAPCKRKRDRYIKTRLARWAKAHAEGRLTPEDRAMARRGIDATLEEYALLE